MKKLVGNLVWLSVFSLMVCASLYPQVSGVAQSLAWAFNTLAVIAVPGLMVIVSLADKKEDLEKFAKERSALHPITGWIKTLAMFAAISFAGFTIAACIYIIVSLLARLVRPLAEQRLEKMA